MSSRRNRHKMRKIDDNFKLSKSIPLSRSVSKKFRKKRPQTQSNSIKKMSLLVILMMDFCLYQAAPSNCCTHKDEKGSKNAKKARFSSFSVKHLSKSSMFCDRNQTVRKRLTSSFRTRKTDSF